MTNYRPVSNISLVSTLVERIIGSQLMDYLAANSLILNLQSAYRRHNSTETAILKELSMPSDVFLVADKLTTDAVHLKA